MRPVRLLIVIAFATVLAGCGADGEPVQPTFSGGVGVGSSGVHGYGGVGLNKGPLNVWLGF
ncbi:hypothetical protein ACFORG_04805 [Lutimaribacter marinistellae]|uniref:Lipoprotein n=1 Tax=Lutimaribacter marinistellae TaxID=1820329 RepID=A0ABV7TBY6_9RHOB